MRRKRKYTWFCSPDSFTSMRSTSVVEFVFSSTETGSWNCPQLWGCTGSRRVSLNNGRPPVENVIIIYWHCRRSWNDQNRYSATEKVLDQYPICHKVWLSCYCCNTHHACLLQASVSVISDKSSFWVRERYSQQCREHFFSSSITSSSVPSGSKSYCLPFFNFTINGAAVFETLGPSRR